MSYIGKSLIEITVNLSACFSFPKTWNKNLPKKQSLREKFPDTELFLVLIFPHSEFLSVFSPNAGKQGPEITPYLDTSRSV